MSDFVNVWENHINSFKKPSSPDPPVRMLLNLCYAATLCKGPDKLQVKWSYFAPVGLSLKRELMDLVLIGLVIG